MSITGIGDFRINSGSVNIDIDTNQYSIDEYKDERSEYSEFDQNDANYLYKKGNRMIWEFTINQFNYTDAEFEALFIELDKINGTVVNFYPHYSDKPALVYPSWMVAFLDRYSEYPVQKIVLKLKAVNLYGGITATVNPWV